MPVHPFLTQPPPDPPPCLAWLYGLSRKTNEWWWSLPGSDPAYLVLPIDLGLHILSRKGVEAASGYVEGVAEQVRPFFEEDRAGLEAELRSFVMERASDRRLRPALETIGSGRRGA